MAPNSPTDRPGERHKLLLHFVLFPPHTINMDILKLKKLNKDELDLVIALFDLLEKIIGKYEIEDEEAAQIYKVAYDALKLGLEKYRDKKSESTLGLYVTWFIKTAIETELGYVTENTKIWKKGPNSRQPQ